MMICSTGMTVENFDSISDETLAVKFTLATDGICLLLFFIRLFYAFRYVRSALFPPKMDY